ncbi:hypothetical protein HS041_20610 [Planomonospora sp. ID67723]|uniref:hypothetical protein n=1 Tax=Planomonospora sp. ID67723 TaxID=2738134 RepID=UPI0018C3E67B|nr:hypothetical protein [Planomonospora sp. ID67723]MBG0830170.1 hypothetical protein [Planomonospora sp. ID67723]
MAFTGKEHVSRPRPEAMVVIGGWAAFAAAAAAWRWFAQDNESRTPYWGVVAGVITVAIAVVVTLMIVCGVRAGRADAGGSRGSSMPGRLLAVAAWLVGGLFAFFDLILQHDKRSGSGTGCSFESLNRPAPEVEALGGLLALSATPALVVLLIAARRSRVIAWLSPVLILGLYLLGMHLWEAHGTETTCSY